MQPLFVDIETTDYDGTEITLICVNDPVSDTIRSYHGEGLRDFDLDPSRLIVGHNFIWFDWPILCRHFPKLRERNYDLYDTLVVSRLFNYRRDGGHSLANLGSVVGVPKGQHADFSVYSPELDTYCQQDTRALRAVYETQQRFACRPEWAPAIRLELEWAKLCRRVHETGFWFDQQAADAIREELTEIRDRLLHRLTTDFPPLVRLVKEVLPQITKSGNFFKRDFNWYDGEDFSCFTEGAPFSVIEYETFNPGSTKMVVEVLNKAGWKPYEKTEGHKDFLRSRQKDPERAERFRTYGWKVSEANLSTLPDTAPAAAHDLVVYRVLDRRLNMLEQWLAARKQDGRIHGIITPIATWTHRVAHSDPNTGNIVRPFGNQESYTPVERFKRDYDGRLRACWAAQPGSSLCGVDIKSAHLRILAHLIDDAEYTKELLSGDPHTLTMNKLGTVCKSRNKAKTFIYTWLNGGKDAKIAEIFETTPDAVRHGVESFVSSMPGLDRLINHDIPRDAARGYFEGIDGRLVAYSEEHGMIAGYLQNAERILLSTAALATEKFLEEKQIGRIVNLVHDECQIEFEGGEEVGNMIGSTFVRNLQEAGQKYNLRCPIDGDFKIGKNWKESH